MSALNQLCKSAHHWVHVIAFVVLFLTMFSGEILLSFLSQLFAASCLVLCLASASSLMISAIPSLLSSVVVLSEENPPDRDD